ncbi:RING-type domain-containing protein [Mycena indigotica]|uniref:RING-type domain-containing protein n=1 Tax=Mycena indigotica TaxID=2126181 RepID=A0A8H6S511_9AGAR|nr:RING-type domain-containing protein [Mycena indigotica]KAF7292888.1 RING-type domain-containing protein [Mycena indigotica]
MPATRKTARQDTEVITLDDNSSKTVANKRTTSRTTTTTTKKTAGQVAQARKENHRPTTQLDIIEISSDEDEVPPPPKAAAPPGGAKMARMQERLKQLERDNLRLEQENKLLTQCSSELDDGVSCEICSCKMWSPFILAECGHTFCQKDLEDWFQAALTRHRATYPNYNVNQQHPYAHIPGYAIQMPQPTYTCPKCRTNITTKPIQNFAVKHLARVVAKQSRESSPKKVGGNTASPWSRFFVQ